MGFRIILGGNSMNKRSRNVKGASRRWLALLLCCLCLLGLLPIHALATQTEESLTQEQPTLTTLTGTGTETPDPDTSVTGTGTETPDPNATVTGTGTETPDPDTTVTGTGTETPDPNPDPIVTDTPTTETPAEQNLYEKLMAAESCQAMYDLLNATEPTDVEALTDEELTALLDYVNTLEDDGCKDDLLLDLTALRDNEPTMTPGGSGSGGWGGGGNELDLSRYKSTSLVYWDTTTGTSSATGKQDSRITSITLNGTVVKWGDSGDGRKNGWSYDKASGSGGTALGTYFPNGSTIKEVTSVLSITPAAGYYVTKVVVACLDPNSASPYGCNTWAAGNAFEDEFTVGTSGTVDINVTNEDFSHTSGSGSYYILIQLAPIPSPLYVEYWPGEITDYVDSSVTIFTDSDGWTNQGTGNNLGTAGEVQTNYTQYMYKYSTNSSEAANWKHYANSITSEAKAAAANAGYYFTGWRIEYYSECTTKNDGSEGRNYTYTFSESYGTGTAQPGEDVRLTTNCKLIAQWKPIQLQLTKTVSGLEGNFLSNHIYKIQVQKQNGDGDWENYDGVKSLTVDGNSSSTVTLSCITPGTYRAVEADESKQNLKNDTTVMYITVNEGGTVTYNTTDIKASQTLEVKNAYSPKPATATIIVEKEVTGNMGSHNDSFTFTVTGNTYEGAENSFTLKHGEKKEITVNIGDTITVTEAAANGYTTSYKIGDTTAVSGREAKIEKVEGNETIRFINDNEVTISTGVLLDTLPYVLILVLVAGGAVLLLRRKRRED